MVFQIVLPHWRLAHYHKTTIVIRVLLPHLRLASYYETTIGIRFPKKV